MPKKGHTNRALVHIHCTIWFDNSLIGSYALCSRESARIREDNMISRAQPWVHPKSWTKRRNDDVLLHRMDSMHLLVAPPDTNAMFNVSHIKQTSRLAFPWRASRNLWAAVPHQSWSSFLVNITYNCFEGDGALVKLKQTIGSRYARSGSPILASEMIVVCTRCSYQSRELNSRRL